MEECENDIPIFIVDAFSRIPFQGNPAAVCLLKNGKEVTDMQKQAIAAEMNLSETAFVETLSEDADFTKGNRFKLRWFTPTNEVPLCGHATVASAAALFTGLGNRSDQITFESLSGDLITRRTDGGITMNFPLNTPKEQNTSDYTDLLKLITSPENIFKVFYSPTTKKLLVRLQDSLTRDFLESLRPDISAFVAADTSGRVKGVIVTVRGSRENGCTDDSGRVYDFVSRYFAPWNGIPEDPVTGSAHTVLAPYWGDILGKGTLYGTCAVDRLTEKTDELTWGIAGISRQCSKRGGDVIMELRGDDRVDITGDAVIVMSGKLKI